jgi:hypothetical protein
MTVYTFFNNIPIIIELNCIKGAYIFRAKCTRLIMLCTITNINVVDLHVYVSKAISIFYQKGVVFTKLDIYVFITQAILC